MNVLTVLWSLLTNTLLLSIFASTILGILALFIALVILRLLQRQHRKARVAT